MSRSSQAESITEVMAPSSSGQRIEVCSPPRSSQKTPNAATVQTPKSAKRATV